MTKPKSDMLTTDRPLVNFDLEATSANPEEARIIQVAAKRWPDEEKFVRTVNPQMQVDDHILELTGLEQLELDSAAPWQVVGEQFAGFIRDADLMGYNIVSYDYPLLKAEYDRAFKTVVPGPQDRRLIDCYMLEKRLRPRDLASVLERRTGHVLGEQAHDAEADMAATEKILLSQLDEMPGAVHGEIEDVYDFQTGDYLDPEGKLKETEHGVVVTFGKHSGRTLKWLKRNDRGYLSWMYRNITQLEPYIDEVFSGDS